MSLHSNTSLQERAYELAEELTSHPAGLDRAIIRALESGDLEELAHWVAVSEQVLAQQHFYETSILAREATDVA